MPVETTRPMPEHIAEAFVDLFRGIIEGGGGAPPDVLEKLVDDELRAAGVKVKTGGKKATAKRKARAKK